MTSSRRVAFLLPALLVAGLDLVWAQERESEGRGRRHDKVGPTMRRSLPRDSPYQVWLQKAKTEIPVFEGLVIDDIRTVELRPWPAMGDGISGLYVRLSDYQITDARILEIPPHASTKPQRHMFEMAIYYCGGPGHTIVQQEERRPQRVDWSLRSLYSVPLNVRYQHFNDGDEPVRLLAVTSFPLILNATNSLEFVYENPFKFTDRYDAEEDHVRKSEHVEENETITNFVKDALQFELDAYDRRGEGTTNMHWTMAGQTMIRLHVSEMPSQVYKRAHRHSSDAFILLLSGEGYSLTWAEDAYDERVRVDWHEGTLFVPPIYWYHQHLNPGTDSARYLAINAPPIVRNLGLRFQDQLEEDLPQIREEFDREVAKRSAAPRQD